ncbi:MAG: zinc-ribbon domain-containing protein [Clostridia bacterium]|nr:zinc-ribbon domain-containing protein [Clostridia bacterium]
MFCESCGKPLEEGSTFCINCGSPIGIAANENLQNPIVTVGGSQPVPAVNNSTPVKFWQAALAFLIVPVAAAIYILISGGLSPYTVPAKNNPSETSSSEKDRPSESQKKKTLADIQYHASASSYLVWNNQNPYYPKHVCDGRRDTAWIEGVSGTGINEWIRLDFDDYYEISGLSIINGFAKSEKNYYYEGRVASVRIEAENFSMTAMLDDDCLTYQKINFGEKVKTNYVKVTILDVYVGDSDYYTAISELSVY